MEWFNEIQTDLDPENKTSNLQELISCVTELATLVESHLSGHECQEDSITISLGPGTSNEAWQITKRLDRLSASLERADLNRDQ